MFKRRCVSVSPLLLQSVTSTNLDTLRETLAHEIGHEVSGAEGFDQIKKAALKATKKEDRDKWAADYRRMFPGMSEPDVDEEVAMKALGRRLATPRFLDRYAENRTFMGKLIDGAKYILKYMRENQAGRLEMDELSKLIKMMDEALIKGEVSQNEATGEGGTKRHNVVDLTSANDHYSYQRLISKRDVEITQLSTLNDQEINRYKQDKNIFAKEIRDIAARDNNPKNTDTTTYIYCKDLDKDVLVSKDSFKHGAARMDSTYISVCKNIINVIKNSIVVNEVNSRDATTSGGYVLLSIAENEDDYVIVRSLVNKKTWKLEEYNELYSVRKKSVKKEDVGFKPPHYTKKSGYGTSSVISISDFLQIVNSQKIGNSVLPIDVVEHLNAQRSFDQNITQHLRYNISDKGEPAKNSDISPTSDEAYKAADQAAREAAEVEAFRNAQDAEYDRVRQAELEDDITTAAERAVFEAEVSRSEVSAKDNNSRWFAWPDVSREVGSIVKEYGIKGTSARYISFAVHRAFNGFRAEV